MVSLDPMAGVSRNSYKGDFVNMQKVEDYAVERAGRGETTMIHYHTFLERCQDHEHKIVSPESLEKKDA